MADADFNELPAMIPPPGHTPNFVDPETLHPAVLSVAIVCMTLMTIAVAIRVYTKAFILREMRVEEYFAIIATVGILVWDALFIDASINGFSRHLYDVRLVHVSRLSYQSYVAEITNAITMFAAKASILFQLRRIFCTGQSRDSVFWAIHILVFLSAAYYTSATFTFIFQCSPREKTWNAFIEGHCIDVAAATVVAGAVNLFLDIGILITPLWAIWHLQLPMKRKLGISAVFGVGILTCAIAAIGVAFRIPLLHDPDLTWLITKVGIWTMVEYCGTILVGCMPSFPRFFLHLRGHDLPTSSSAAGSNSHPSAGRAHAHAHSPSATSAYHSAMMQQARIKGGSSGAGIGMAVTTSEVSFGDHAYIEMEAGYGVRHSDEESTARGSGGDDADWSPLSSPK
ncbi:hypothetical protein B0H67DRAFT_582515 [Lasiosphaeris hirsuta]|uniref:Rhodopsin domain-containing protein n=1 Tax=Lasiosphaeris hirsuta TaxID=260670 RepID=A0AA40AHY3_9PEZI|nr:hypothetical protein B0H67DRAFT_582515 [Lasiosphaeris hirsuta]